MKQSAEGEDINSPGLSIFLFFFLFKVGREFLFSVDAIKHDSGGTSRNEALEEGKKKAGYRTEFNKV